eukprot:1028791_1
MFINVYRSPISSYLSSAIYLAINLSISFAFHWKASSLTDNTIYNHPSKICTHQTPIAFHKESSTIWHVGCSRIHYYSFNTSHTGPDINNEWTTTNFSLGFSWSEGNGIAYCQTESLLIFPNKLDTRYFAAVNMTPPASYIRHFLNVHTGSPGGGACAWDKDTNTLYNLFNNTVNGTKFYYIDLNTFNGTGETDWIQGPDVVKARPGDTLKASQIVDSKLYFVSRTIYTGWNVVYIDLLSLGDGWHQSNATFDANGFGVKSFQFEGYIYYVGGKVSQYVNSKRVFKYDPQTDTAVVAPSFVRARYGISCFVNSNRGIVYLIGGWDMNMKRDWQYSVNFTYSPTYSPTTITIDPTHHPTTITIDPTVTPTVYPSHPTKDPSAPTIDPSVAPTLYPTINPSQTPTLDPSAAPTTDPSTTPTLDPSVAPTIYPTSNPSIAPTIYPTIEPTIFPSMTPTVVPTINPSLPPTGYPSAPSVAPTEPTHVPTYSEAAVDEESEETISTSNTKYSEDEQNIKGTEISNESVILAVSVLSVAVICVVIGFVCGYWNRKGSTNTDGTIIKMDTVPGSEIVNSSVEHKTKMSFEEMSDQPGQQTIEMDNVDSMNNTRGDMTEMVMDDVVDDDNEAHQDSSSNSDDFDNIFVQAVGEQSVSKSDQNNVLHPATTEGAKDQKESFHGTKG